MEPDETVHDVLRVLRSSRGTGLTGLDARLPGGCLVPGELVVLQGATSAAKAALLRDIVAAYVAPASCGGHSLPVAFVDTRGTFDILDLARLLEVRFASAIGACSADISKRERAEGVEEGLSRLLVLRPEEPADLLRLLHGLRDVCSANPTMSLLVVDSMSTWHPLAMAFPRSTGPFLREAWRALDLLQREHCIAVVATCCDASLADGGAAVAAARVCTGEHANQIVVSERSVFTAHGPHAELRTASRPCHRLVSHQPLPTNHDDRMSR
mmetsp:Transcript_46926/g.130704  ORF Transcript_46926/g.130704 Transcript_46926/m.130704 type:complete len:269 (+) Transcript_46926:94-900(+)